MLCICHSWFVPFKRIFTFIFSIDINLQLIVLICRIISVLSLWILLLPYLLWWFPIVVAKQKIESTHIASLNFGWKIICDLIGQSSFIWNSLKTSSIILKSVKLDVHTLEIDPIKFEIMLTNEYERDIQLELNRNYLKSFPARLKFCHIVSVLANGVTFGTNFDNAIKEVVEPKAVWHWNRNYKLINVLLFFQFLGSLSSGLLIYFTSEYFCMTFVSISIASILALCSLIFLVSSTINWKTNGKIRMARINFVSIIFIS